MVFSTGNPAFIASGFCPLPCPLALLTLKPNYAALLCQLVAALNNPPASPESHMAEVFVYVPLPGRDQTSVFLEHKDKGEKGSPDHCPSCPSA